MDSSDGKYTFLGFISTVYENKRLMVLYWK